MFSSVLITLLYVSGVLSATLGPCTKEDHACISNAIGKIFPDVVSGVPSRGINSVDPVYQELLEGEIPLLKYKFINTTVTGFSKCVLKNSNLNLDTLKFTYEMDCPGISMCGNYEIYGNLIMVHVEGKGPYDIITSRYWAGVETDLHLYKRNDKTYMKMSNLKLKLKALGPIKFDFKNLFNGRQDLSDAVHNFAHENWKEVARLTDKQIFIQNLKVIMKNYNRYLKYEPLEEVIVDF